MTIRLVLNWLLLVCIVRKKRIGSDRQDDSEDKIAYFKTFIKTSLATFRYTHFHSYAPNNGLHLSLTGSYESQASILLLY